MKNKKNDKENKSKKIEIKLTKDIEDKENEDILENDYDPKLDPEHIVIFDCELDLIEDSKAVDLLFLIDTTGSMNCYLKGIKKLMRKIIWDLRKCLSKYLIDEIDILKVGIVTYKDHEDEDKTYLTNIEIDLNGDLNKVNNTIMTLNCGGGKDEPEAVLDGLKVAINDISWREHSIKYIYHILDAPCHGKKYNNIEGDKLEECPNNIDVEDLFVEIRNKNINYTVIKLNDSIDKMLQEFKNMASFEVITPKVYFDKKDIIPQD